MHLALTELDGKRGSYRVIVWNPYASVTSAPVLLSVYPSAAATLTSASYSPLFRFTVNGVPGLNYAVLASTNMQGWTPLVTNASPFTFEDTNASHLRRRFYRAVYVP